MENLNSVSEKIQANIKNSEHELIKDFIVVKKDLIIDKIQKMAEAYLEKEKIKQLEEYY